MKQLFSCDLTRKKSFCLILPFQGSFVFIQKDPILDRYPISDGALFSNYFVTSGYHRLIYCFLFLICVIFHVINHFSNISHVVDKLRLICKNVENCDIPKFLENDKIAAQNLCNYTFCILIRI